MKILCIDDDLTVRTILKTGLKKHCLEDDHIFVVESGEQGMKSLQEHYIDLVITDLNMPGMTGMEVLKEIKDNYSNVETIVLTGHASVNSAVEAMKFGARDYLEKPVNIPLLIEKVSNVRDIIKQKNEVEEYRHAKEMIEDNAGEDIIRLETALNDKQNILDKIKSLIYSETETDNKISEIKSLLS